MASMPRYLGRMVLPKLVKKGLSTPAIIRYLRGHTGSWSRTVMLGDIREVQGIAQFGKAVKSLSSTAIPVKGIMVEADLKAARKYRVFGTAKYINKETARTTYEPISFYDDTLRTKQDWSNEYIRMKETEQYREEVVCETVDIFAIEHNKGFRY